MTKHSRFGIWALATLVGGVGLLLFEGVGPVRATETALTASQATLINNSTPINKRYKIGTRLRELETAPILSGALGFNISGGTYVATAGVLGGAGTSSTRQTIASSGDVKAFSFYTKSTSTTATDVVSGFYYNMDYGTSATSAAPSGDAIRGRAYLVGDASGSSAVTGGAFSVELATTGASNTGLTAGMRGNLVLPDGVMTNSGTFYGTMAEVYLGGAASDTTAYTKIAPLGIVVGGTNPTAAAQIANMSLIDITVPASGIGTSGQLVDTGATTAHCTAKIRITINGTVYWLLADNDHD